MAISSMPGEQQIEQLVFSGEIDAIRPIAGKTGAHPELRRAGRYVGICKQRFRAEDLEKMRMPSSANGAAYKSTQCICARASARNHRRALTRPTGYSISNLPTAAGTSRRKCRGWFRNKRPRGITHEATPIELVGDCETANW